MTEHEPLIIGEDIKFKVLHGFFWVFLHRTSVQALQFLMKLLLARILVPHDFGLIASALLVISCFDLFSSFGIEEAVIQYKEKNPLYVHTAFTLSLGISFLLFFIGFATAPYWGHFFSANAVTPLIRFLSLSFLINAAARIPSTLFDKELQFKEKLTPEILPLFVYIILAYYLALEGYGAWSIAIAYVINQALRSLLYVLLSSYHPQLLLVREDVQRIFSYGKEILFVNILTFFVLQADNLFVARVLGTESLGFYTMAYSLSAVIALSIIPILRQVMFAFYAKIQESDAALQKFFLMTIEMSALIIIPASVGIFFLSEQITLFMIGEKWRLIIIPLQILSIAAIFRTLGGMAGVLFNAVGKPHINKKIGIFQLVALLAFVYPLTLFYGIIGTSIAVLIALGSTLFFVLYYASKIIKLQPFDVLFKLRTPIFCSAFMISSLATFTYFYPIKNLFTLFLFIFIGTLIYCSSIYFLNRPVWIQYTILARRILSALF